MYMRLYESILVSYIWYMYISWLANTTHNPSMSKIHVVYLWQLCLFDGLQNGSDLRDQGEGIADAQEPCPVVQLHPDHPQGPSLLRQLHQRCIPRQRRLQEREEREDTTGEQVEVGESGANWGESHEGHVMRCKA